MPFATPFREIVSNLFFDRNGCLIPVLKFRDEYYYAKDKYRGLFILLPPSMKSRDTRWFMYTMDKQKRTIFFFFTQCFNITCDGEKLFTYLLTTARSWLVNTSLFLWSKERSFRVTTAKPVSPIVDKNKQYYLSLTFSLNYTTWQVNKHQVNTGGLFF